MQNNFWRELRERKVVRVLIGYAVTCFVITQIIDAVGDALGFSNYAIQLLLGGMVTLVPLVAFLAWVFEMSAEGIAFDKRGRFGLGLILSILLTALIGSTAWYTIGTGHDMPLAGLPDDKVSIRKIAVLPFTNIVSDASQNYFVDGMTESLIAELTRVSSLRVVSRTSVMRYQGSEKTLQEIAAELGVSALVEGSVQRDDETVSIVAKLIDARSDENLWANRYTQTLDNVLELQARVALDITREINVVLTPSERQVLTSVTNVDPKALDAYLRGRHFWEQRTQPSFRRALEYFDTAIAFEPGYAAAHAAIADAYGLLAIYEYENPKQAYARTRSAASAAIALDPTIGEPHAALGLVYSFVDRDWDQADTAYLHARELSPNNPNTHVFHAVHLLGVGDMDSAEAALKTARRIDPLTPLAGSFETQLSYYRRQPERAIAIAKQALELNPDFPATLWHLGEAYLAADRNLEAAETFERIATLTRRHPMFLAHLGHAYVRLGRIEDAESIMTEIRDKTMETDVEAGRLARIYVALGEHEKAIDALYQSLPAAQRQILDLGRGPKWDPLRSNPRFQALLQELKFDLLDI
ncbi:MAG: tetratricopeptide repeat protein [Pseudomonadales bacterium]|nr:tetratricopeptide repeat protein [Pseudomonadales bacterium]